MVESHNSSQLKTMNQPLCRCQERSLLPLHHRECLAECLPQSTCSVRIITVTHVLMRRFHLRTCKFGKGAWTHRWVSFHLTPWCDQGLPSAKVKWDPTLALTAGGCDLPCG